MDDDGETTYETAMFCVLTLKYAFICVYWFVLSLIRRRIYLPQQGVVDSYNLASHTQVWYLSLTMDIFLSFKRTFQKRQGVHNPNAALFLFAQFRRACFLFTAEQGLSQWEKSLHR